MSWCCRQVVHCIAVDIVSLIIATQALLISGERTGVLLLTPLPTLINAFGLLLATLNWSMSIHSFRDIVGCWRLFLSCGGGTQPITVTVGGSKTSSVSYTASASFNLNIEGIDIGGGGFSTEEGTQVQTSNSTTYIVSPGRQVVQTIGVLHHSETGNVQVNFGKRVAGHYEVKSLLLLIWDIPSELFRLRSGTLVPESRSWFLPMT